MTDRHCLVMTIRISNKTKLNSVSFNSYLILRYIQIIILCKLIFDIFKHCLMSLNYYSGCLYIGK